MSCVCVCVCVHENSSINSYEFLTTPVTQIHSSTF